jgi:hypothetical protein
VFDGFAIDHDEVEIDSFFFPFSLFGALLQVAD